jgi:uncharacterized BrkB/YihY/UPF0761 family membrane protein
MGSGPGLCERYSATYGALASVVVLLLYLLISAAILLLGAEINAESYRGRAEGSRGVETRTGKQGRRNRRVALPVSEGVGRVSAPSLWPRS